MPMSRLLNLLTMRLRRDRQPLFVAVVAVVVGVLVGLAAVGFIKLLQGFQLAFFGIEPRYLASSLRQAMAESHWVKLTVVLVPMLGGLLVGVLTRLTMPDGRPQGIADVIEANAMRGGHLSSRVGWQAALLSALSMGAGASVGREGPIVHFGASIGSLVARGLHLTRHHARTMLTCGVAAAIAASFNAPLAGVFFALEVVIGHYGFAAFAPIVLSAVSATAVSRFLLGDETAFVIPSQTIANVLETPAFMMLGVAGGMVALIFMASVRMAKRAFARSRIPSALRPAVAGFLLGLIALGLPEVLGVGYEGTDMALQGQLGFSLAFALLVAKILACALCLGAGFSGGVFAPALFLGAMLGTAFGSVAVSLVDVPTSALPVYSMVGMAAVGATVLGSPISSILMLFELTGEYSLLLVVMVAVVMAVFVTRLADIHSFFTSQLEDRGIFVKDGHDVSVLERVSVGSIMDQQFWTLPPDADMATVKQTLLASNWGRLCVLDQQGRLLGVISLTHDRDRLDAAELTAGDLAHDGPYLTPEMTLADAVKVLRNSGEAHIPVLNSELDRIVVGQVHEHDLNHAYHEALLSHEGFDDLERVYQTERRS